jgi:hypothetical protein
MRRLAACAFVAFALGCSAEPSARAARSPLIAESELRAVFASPARWRYHPREAAAMLATQPLEGGAVLFAGERGERWQTGPAAISRAAARLAPEPLVAILRPGQGSWLFVGRSGTGYEAREPLGPFVRSSAPVDMLERVAAAGSTIVGVRRDGGLVRSADAGATWRRVGPDAARFSDVALGDRGRGVALAVPEKLFGSEDEGLTWQALAVPSVGALDLHRDQKAGLVVRSVLGPHRLDAAHDKKLVPLARRIEPHRFALGVGLARGPDASALAQRRAFVTGGDYVEASREKAKTARQTRAWRLVLGRFDGSLRTRPLPLASGCNEVRLAGFGRSLALACARQGGRGGQILELSLSRDGGDSFEIRSLRAEGKLEELRMAVGADGELLVTGICPSHDADKGCSPRGVFRMLQTRSAAKRQGVSRPEGQAELVPSATPTLDGAAEALAFSVDGRIAYAAGLRNKNGQPALFVSRDGGRSFETRDLSLATSDDSDSDSDGEVFGVPTATSMSIDLSPAEDESMALIVKSGQSSTLIVTDEDGRVSSRARPPEQDVLIGAAGSRALALSPASRRAWESLDGGVSWDPIGRLPADLCPEDASCEVPLVCRSVGCVVGDELSRIGWRGQGDDDLGVLSPADASATDLFDRKLSAPLACTLAEGPWQPLERVDRMPDAHRAMLGKAAWFAVGQDAARAAVWTVSAPLSGHGRMETTPLLAAVARPEMYAYRALPNVEGIAALRYRVPEARPGETRLLELEVAWHNLLEGRLGRGRLSDAGAYQAGDYRRGDGRSQEARPDLLSIASGGLYVRIHHAAKDQQPTFFFDGKRVATVPAVSWPELEGEGHEAEMIHVDGKHVPVRFIGRGSAIARAGQSADRSVFSAYTTGLPAAEDFELAQDWGLSYVDGRAALLVGQRDLTGTLAATWLYPIRASGPVVDAPIAAPTQRDSAERPTRCSPEQRATSPRVVAPYLPGTRHAVVIADAVEPLRVLLTGAAVMHGTPDAACVAAFEAEIVAIDTTTVTENERAIIPLAELDAAWLFRLLPATGEEPRVEARRMSCRFDPNLEVPAEVYQAPGTVIRRRP